MSLRICSISSSSGGNCIYVASDSTRILIDAGAPFVRVAKSLKVLGAGAGDLNVLVTHTHRDHIAHLATYVKQAEVNVFASGNAGLGAKQAVKHTEFDREGFAIGDIWVSPFSVSHDVPCTGYTLRNKSGAISVLTDLGTVDEQVIRNIIDSDIVLIESNHDEHLVTESAYPHFLKRRILSTSGHLSNSACAKVCSRLVTQGKVRQIILGHLSLENNYPELAFNTMQNTLMQAGCTEGKDYALEVAPAERMSGLYSVGFKAD